MDTKITNKKASIKTLGLQIIILDLALQCHLVFNFGP